MPLRHVVGLGAGESQRSDLRPPSQGRSPGESLRPGSSKGMTPRERRPVRPGQSAPRKRVWRSPAGQSPVKEAARGGSYSESKAPSDSEMSNRLLWRNNHRRPAPSHGSVATALPSPRGVGWTRRWEDLSAKREKAPSPVPRSLGIDTGRFGPPHGGSLRGSETDPSRAGTLAGRWTGSVSTW